MADILTGTGLWMSEREAEVAGQRAIAETRQGLHGDRSLHDVTTWVADCGPEHWRVLLLLTGRADTRIGE